jgi:hypothetical protein
MREESEPGRVSHTERWVLFRSAQFAHNRAFDEIPQLGGRVHVFEVLDTTTAAFEFAARLARQGVLSPEAVVTFELHGLDGRQLIWPTDIFGGSHLDQDYWCRDEGFSVGRQSSPRELEAQSRALALSTAFEIYSNFGWSNPPTEIFEKAQTERFRGV